MAMEKATNGIALISLSLQFLIGLHTNGRVYEAYDELIKVDQAFRDEIEDNEQLKVLFNSTAALILHDLDKSKQLLHHAKVCITGYEKMGDIQSQVIFRINYADALWALGYLHMAESHLKETCDICEKDGLSQTKGIAFIHYANVLSSLNNGLSASAFYEEGISLASAVDRDCIYGKIYQGFNQLQLNRQISQEYFLQLLTQCKESKYHYLADLAFSAVCIEHTISDHTVSLKDVDHQPVLPSGNLFYLVNLILTNQYNQQIINSFLSILGKCEGIKIFKAQILSTLEKLIDHQLIADDIQKEFAVRWFHSFSPAIGNDEVIKLKACDYRFCEARCCYDGVYLQEGEEEKIIKAVNAFPWYFDHLPNDFIVDASWGSIKGRKTAVRYHAYSSPDYPDHFTKTRCVFAALDGACSLQRASVEAGGDKWTFKPKACRTHPLQCRHFDFQAPPTSTGEDKFNVGVSYPGYVSYTPCGINRADGNVWVDELKDEVLDFQSEDIV